VIRVPDPNRLLVIAPNWLGDIVMALPALADLRKRFAAATLVIASRQNLAPIFQAVPGVDQLIVLDDRRKDVQALRQAGADAVLLLPNSFRSAWLAWRAGVPARWGYRTDMRDLLLTEAVVPPRQPRAHHATYYQHLTTSLGCEAGPLRVRLERREEDDRAGGRVLEAAGWKGERLVGIAPGAANGTAKQWPPERMGEVAARLIAEYDVSIALLGSGGDVAAARDLVARIDALRAPAGRVHNVTGRTSLGELVGIAARCAAFLSNDSGAMHLAAALDVPVVAVFGPTREWATSPLPGPSGRKAIVVTEDVFCRPCMLQTCPIDHRCMTRIEVSRVLNAVASQLMAGAAA
jgi:heptosyltransferase-2